ncbi:uncharacterized protein F4807DRAFT_156482 [Annulohypoxylon truncatum]|uniref:uncharacterized protein n=1 Tax=Annulohypoxylon truncatum TaxID=327061 RepID=UPI002007BDD4|nr:uncharacterized protein F4807DRAFT_156482 [Annulohypoxylon truncatum]KAI1208218.1 hypothetical protein F4807DRAFT_156482 [Annulohypoxylon truncatum]
MGLFITSLIVVKTVALVRHNMTTAERLNPLYRVLRIDSKRSRHSPDIQVLTDHHCVSVASLYLQTGQSIFRKSIIRKFPLTVIRVSENILQGIKKRLSPLLFLFFVRVLLCIFDHIPTSIITIHHQKVAIMAVGLGERLSGCQRCQEIEDEESKKENGYEALGKICTNGVQNISFKPVQIFSPRLTRSTILLGSNRMMPLQHLGILCNIYSFQSRRHFGRLANSSNLGFDRNRWLHTGYKATLLSSLKAKTPDIDPLKPVNSGAGRCA